MNVVVGIHLTLEFSASYVAKLVISLIGVFIDLTLHTRVLVIDLHLQMWLCLVLVLHLPHM